MASLAPLGWAGWFLVACVGAGTAFAALGAIAEAIDRHARLSDLRVEARRIRNRRARPAKD